MKFSKSCSMVKMLTSLNVQLYIIVIKYVIIVIKNSKRMGEDVTMSKYWGCILYSTL